MEHKFEPFQKVLVRNHKDFVWHVDFFSHYKKNSDHTFITISGGYCYCLPFEGNESLLGTIDSPTPKHEFKTGDYVEVYWAGIWNIGVYLTKKENEHVVYSMVDDTMYRTEDDEIRPLAEDSDALPK